MFFNIKETIFKISSYIYQHISGNLSLARTFWANYVLVNLALILIALLMLVSLYAFFNISVIKISDFMLRYIPLITLLAWIIFGVQVIGLVMCMSRYIFIQKRYLWPILVVMVLTVDMAGHVKSAIDDDNLQDDLRFFAACGDPLNCKDDIGKYNLSTQKNGTALHIEGYFAYGISDNVEKYLTQNSNIKYIHLTSPGGHAYEGLRLYKIIKDKNLSTYVSKKCASACAVAFMGGYKRDISSSAKLGFHSAGFCEDDKPEWAQKLTQKIHLIMFQMHSKNQLFNSFLQRAYKVPFKDIWYPSVDELYSANIITRVVD